MIAVLGSCVVKGKDIASSSDQAISSATKPGGLAGKVVAQEKLFVRVLVEVCPFV